jgi:hypothetical protein
VRDAVEKRPQRVVGEYTYTPHDAGMVSIPREHGGMVLCGFAGFCRFAPALRARPPPPPGAYKGRFFDKVPWLSS